jgi:hypothetical protein
MKGKNFLGIVFLLLLGVVLNACAFLVPAATGSGLLEGSRTAPQLEALVGTWQGAYSAPAGETEMTLSVYKEGNNYKATLFFYNVPGRPEMEGEFYMNASYHQSTGKYVLIAYQWIKRPGSNWIFFDLDGSINENVFSGSAVPVNRQLGIFSFQTVRQ